MIKDFSNLTQQSYNKIAEDWYLDHHDDDWWVVGIDYLVSLLPVGATVLDVGCGCGWKARYLRERGFVVTGIDYSENLLAIAERENFGSEFLLLDMHEAAKLNKQFDCIFAQASLLHIPRAEIGSMIKSLSEILKPGGLFYAAVKGIKEDRPEEGIITDTDYGYEFQRFFSYHRPEEMRKHFIDAGLKVVWKNVKKTGNCEWIQIIGKK